MSTISTGHARKLVQNYKRLKINKKIKGSETRAVWFSRQEIETALNTQVAGVLPTGLRFYFAAYEQKSTTHPTHPPKYAQENEKVTLVIVPTKGVNNSGNVVNHPHRVGEIIHFDLLTTPTAPPDYDFNFREANDGQICPPPPLNDLGLDNGL